MVSRLADVLAELESVARRLDDHADFDVDGVGISSTVRPSDGELLVIARIRLSSVELHDGEMVHVQESVAIRPEEDLGRALGLLERKLARVTFGGVVAVATRGFPVDRPRPIIRSCGAETARDEEGRSPCGKERAHRYAHRDAYGRSWPRAK